MRPVGDQPRTNQGVTVAEAAAVLGISEDAVRSRLKRGTLTREKNLDGSVCVVLGAEGHSGRPTTNQQTDQYYLREMIGGLQEQMEFLRQQLIEEREANKENRRIIAGLVHRVPELESANPTRGDSSFASGFSESDSANLSNGPQRRSWFRRFLRV